jgi:hypothetical protein
MHNAKNSQFLSPKDYTVSKKGRSGVATITKTNSDLKFFIRKTSFCFIFSFVIKEFKISLGRMKKAFSLFCSFILFLLR